MGAVKRILVVDDDDDVREMIIEYLGCAGFMVHGAADTVAMMHELRSHRVDLVLLDRTMPSGDSINLVPQLRKDWDVGVILVTAMVQAEERARGLDVGADDYISKPFNWVELTARINAVLRRVAERTNGVKTISARLGRPRRRVSTVLFADVVGFTRLMRADEAGTLREWRFVLRSFVHQALAAHGGRLVKLTGDGFIADFAAAEQAVAAAVSIQIRIARRNLSRSVDQCMNVRIGIHRAPVFIVDDGDLYGDGVNLAARLQAMADPGGISISSTVWAGLSRVMSAQFCDRGLQAVKSVREPVHVFAWRPIAHTSGASVFDPMRSPLSQPA